MWSFKTWSTSPEGSNILQVGVWMTLVFHKEPFHHSNRHFHSGNTISNQCWQICYFSSRIIHNCSTHQYFLTLFCIKINFKLFEKPAYTNDENLEVTKVWIHSDERQFSFLLNSKVTRILCIFKICKFICHSLFKRQMFSYTDRIILAMRSHSQII